MHILLHPSIFKQSTYSPTFMNVLYTKVKSHIRTNKTSSLETQATFPFSSTNSQAKHGTIREKKDERIISETRTLISTRTNVESLESLSRRVGSFSFPRRVVLHRVHGNCALFCYVENCGSDQGRFAATINGHFQKSRWKKRMTLRATAAAAAAGSGETRTVTHCWKGL